MKRKTLRQRAEAYATRQTGTQFHGGWEWKFHVSTYIAGARSERRIRNSRTANRGQK